VKHQQEQEQEQEQQQQQQQQATNIFSNMSVPEMALYL
jgi:hypothetical protein